MAGENPRDPLGAFCPGPRLRVEGAASGPLAGLTFAAKDNFDVAGFVTGAGCPEWAATHAPAARTAAAVERLLDAGATLVGKTVMDPLAWGSLGENEHYGTPVNPAAPGRIPGGSSSGSASAVAGGLADFALGSDSACSVRLPAALCGLFGFRPTHGRISVEGLIPLSPSLDTVGWLAREAGLLAKVGTVLLRPAAPPPPPRILLVVEDAFAMASPGTVRALQPAIRILGERMGGATPVRVGREGQEERLESLWQVAWSVEIREAWALHGRWIEETRPAARLLDPARFAEAAGSSVIATERARARFLEWGERIRGLIPPDAVLCLPTTTDGAPALGADREARRAFALPTLCLMSIAGVAGLPQVTLPVARVGGCPAGLSLVAAPGSDEALLRLAEDLTNGPAALLRRVAS